MLPPAFGYNRSKVNESQLSNTLLYYRSVIIFCNFTLTVNSFLSASRRYLRYHILKRCLLFSGRNV